MDDRMVLNGIVREFRMGTAWRDVPERLRDPALGRSAGGLTATIQA
ncbi:transposase [Streptomyces sp. SAI-195]